MKEILGKAKTIRELLGGAKYSIDCYQREYRWQTKHMVAFKSAEMEERCTLYLKLTEHIWNPDRVMEAATT